MQGVVFRPGDLRFEGRSVAEAIDRAIADPTCLMVNRNRGSGTRVVIDGLLRGRKPPGFAVEPRSHNAVAAAVSQGRADWGLAIKPVADAYGLGFLPVLAERYDFAIPDVRLRPPGGPGLSARSWPIRQLGSDWRSWGFLSRRLFE